MTLFPEQRPTYFRSGGFDTLADLVQAQNQQLLQVHGVGPATIRNVRLGLKAQIKNWLVTSSAGCRHLIKSHRYTPRSFRPRHEMIQARNVSPRFAASVDSQVHFRTALLKSAKTSGSFFRRLFDLNGTEAEMAKNYLKLEAWTDSDEVRESEERASFLAAELESPKFSGLAEDYRRRYAEYVAIFESYLDVQYRDDLTARQPQTTWLELADADRYVHGQRQLPHDDRLAPRRAPSIHGDLRSKSRRPSTRFNCRSMHYESTCTRLSAIWHQVSRPPTARSWVTKWGWGRRSKPWGAMVHLAAAEQANKFLIVVPASILGNWVHEIQPPTDFPIRTLHGKARDYELQQWHHQGGLAITSYTTLGSLEGMNRNPIDMLVADEAHYVKNPKSKRSQALTRIAKASKRHVLMSGTPLENNTGEFINLIHTCQPKIAANVRGMSQDGVPEAVDGHRFKHLVSPVYLRRNQEDVLKELPECIEMDEWIDLTHEEWTYYYNAVESRQLMKMRQATLGPGVASSKLQRLEELIEAIRAESQKVVVFSFFLNTLNSVGKSVGQQYRLDGSVAAADRMGIIGEFESHEGFAAMICQIDAAGIGINLHCASAVVLMEPALKPTTEWQAIKRVHRMGRVDESSYIASWREILSMSVFGSC